MTVAHILADKSAEVVSVSPDESVLAAVGLLHERRIGAVLVCEGETVHGIFSERDVVRGLAREGPACLDRPVASLMTADVQTCRPDQPIVEVMGLMTDRRIRHLPVTTDDRLVGIVSIGDLVKRRIAEAQDEAEALRTYITAG
ncbi:inosine-5-monophosphate dehydrogenase [Rhodothalassium salexigens]|uniref:CBS domain-containing protein n=1 Tax=Rhodothalassium salexigens DSM 2132 TaxID=1188247 RepID=A0A4R2PRQ1_RHOSA|nr:CBS domain-containing protein [Rhodothalassium salexigens]MBB4210847.1 CBS domain-containing protein [Rhodothalassium salexigens DSM 2132]MBK1640199.1 inosine-5-monophosphate dehydrogenase [Rhodothalassium salexigens DSM 2132]MBK5912023.1 inosine-5-monophosphate dehydrogenase [Rhodothalassium salexigens]MBK5921219.1 inosine-5-monophosphate dehydrogenase [Rhodothalassium salexigens]TCP37598.1 CBS domain-containing protein [Rhodothalassium salexigens DSM 2132]